ncbi:hypothetical protein RR48_13507 [Papilio machaon]|uniref:Uncharacterized protein n=1 Tax=Papilio machaon TaxID=76193 RepID=A0A194RES7_PAPMA|nr:hypothetical protein RR48_13507 [Papilio machaon]
METSTHQKSFHAERDSLYFQMEALFSWVVFCAQNQGYLQVGDIVWFGNTAALAWQLPTDPKLFYLFKDHEKLYESHRRNDVSKTIYYLDEDGKVLTKMPYKKRLIVNPAFAKRSIEDTYNGRNFSIVIKALHDAQKENNVLVKLDEDSITFHREGRKSFYEKLEKFLEGLGWRGRECVLRILCETGRGKNEQGTFLEEIMRATLTLPQGQKFDKEYHKEYDEAHFSNDDCAKKYSKFIIDCEVNNTDQCPNVKTHLGSIRKRRHLTFPDGSNVVLTISVVKAFMTHAPSGWNLVLEIDVLYPLPDANFTNAHYRRKLHHRQKREFWERIELILENMGYNGRQCILKTLCETTQRIVPHSENMVQEIFRTLFTMPLTKVLKTEPLQHTIYDSAHRLGVLLESCDIYKCPLSLVDWAQGYYNAPAPQIDTARSPWALFSSNFG